MAYMEEMIEQAKNMDLSKPGVYRADVRHDEWCNLLRGKGECNCKPDIKIIRVDSMQQAKTG